MLMHALSEFFVHHGVPVFPASFAHFAFGFANVVFPTALTCEGMEDISKVTGKIMSQLERFFCTFEKETSALARVSPHWAMTGVLTTWFYTTPC